MEYQAGLAQASIYQQAAALQGNARNVMSVPTLSSAASKIDGINTRLAEAIKQLETIHDQIGGPRAVNGESKQGTPELSGAVHRLNAAGDRAHERLGELEGLISLVARALG